MRNRITLLLCLLVLFGLLGCVLGSELPPMPSHDPTPMQLVALGDLPAAVIVDPSYPSERREIKDGQIVEWTGGLLKWHVEPDLFIVEKTYSLTYVRWITVSIASTNAATVYPSGFYRVRRIPHPVPPTTYPPRTMPLASPASNAVAGAEGRLIGVAAKGFGVK